MRVTLPPLAILAAATLCLRPLESRLSAMSWPADMPPPRAGGILGVMGGMRAVVAGGCWLRASLAWERRQPAETMACLRLAVAADETSVYFRLNGARMIACDLPEWRMESGMPEAKRREIREEQARAALEFLADGMRAHPRAPALLIEMANLRLRILGDREGAAELFRQAAVLKGAPFYAARIYAELLIELGRPADALAWLQQVFPGLPSGDPAARREVVAQRIKALEARLGGR